MTLIYLKPKNLPRNLKNDQNTPPKPSNFTGIPLEPRKLSKYP